jgi:CheY-like chemotaxis protein/anti-sigma regulatory factor (Ser/Thr protein kinase)
MLASGRIDERTSKHAVEVIERNAKAQAQLIDDLLDVSRIISGKLRLNVSPVEPGSIVELALDSVSPAAEAKEIKLEAKFDKHIGTIPGDPDRIQQIIWNLLSNAIKFTPNGGKVTIEVHRDPMYIEFTVTDSGQGISAEFLPYVFDRFRQADSTVARAHGGLGLGLAIVRHLAELHGGTVRASSDGEGKGATFTVKLPVQLANTSTTNEQKNTGELTGFHPPIELKGVRILVVDDEPDALDLMKAMLIECGAEVTTAGSSAEGFDSLSLNQPDVLISDIEMPFEDGYSFIRNVRALESNAKLFAVALTAHANAQDKERAIDAGFDLHVRKPVDPSELIAAINSRLERNSTHSE